MTTLLDAPEFAAAKDALSMTLERIEKARQDRLKFLQDALSRTETELDRVKKQALEFPTHIARYRAEIARLEVTTRADILREAMDALKAECWGPPGQAVEVQSQKPHACPRCAVWLRGVEVVAGPYAESYWLFVRADDKAETFTVCDKDGSEKRFAKYDCRFTRPDVPPPSEWCDGSGKGGVE